MATGNYCGEMGLSPFWLLRDWLPKKVAPGLSKGCARQIVYTQTGRTAIALVARFWRIGTHDEVLVPAYNCGSEISPLIATRATVSMYRVNGSAQIDLGDLVSRITSRTRLILVIHYFGRPTDLSELVDICAQRNIKLLEDCALSLFSPGVGCAGDAAIFSLPKTIAACGGGALLLRDQNSKLGEFLQPAEFRVTSRAVFSLLNKWLKASAVGFIFRERSPDEGEMSGNAGLPEMPGKYYWRPESALHSASALAVRTLKRTDPNELIRQRRANYIQLRRLIADVPGIKCLWEEELLPDGICPLGLPALVTNRQRWWKDLNKAGIVVSRWWEGYHRGLDWSDFPEARALKDQLLLLPVHQGLTSVHMDYIADVIRAVSARHFTC
jgi:perosamine synthetase